MKRPAAIRWRTTWNAARLAVTLIALGLAAVNYQSNTAWMLTMLLISAAVVAIFHARRNLAGISGSVGPVPAVFAGDPIPVPVVLRNSAALPAIAVWTTSDGSADEPGKPQMVPAGGSSAALVTLAPRHRGRYTLPALHAVSTFPLGLVAAKVGLAGQIDPSHAPFAQPRKDLAPADAGKSKIGIVRHTCVFMLVAFFCTEAARFFANCQIAMHKF